TLNEFHTRIITNQQPPSSAEILTTLRYFQQTLIGFLKEMPSSSEYDFEKYSAEFHRSNLYPNLNYTGVFYGIVNLIEVFPNLPTAQAAIADAILDMIKALYLFLQRDSVEKLPYLIACQLGVFPNELDKKLLHLLCDCLIPFIITSTDEWLSIPAIMMLVFQHSSDPSLHTLFVESLMAQKQNVYKDIVQVLARGTSEARIAAANLLFHYWPIYSGQILQRRPIQYRVQGLLCDCLFIILANSRKCYNLSISIEYAETTPPILLCKTCSDSLQSDCKIKTMCNPLAAMNNLMCQNKGKRPKWLRQLESGHNIGRDIDKMADERRMLSRFGIWLMSSLCSPTPDADPQSVGYIMSMLFQWFATTALLPNDAMGAALEQLKTDFVSDWINRGISNHYDIYIETLMPYPPEYAQVGGVWDKLSTKKEQMREGLNKLLSIMPYDIITLATWNKIMPFWLKSICEQMESDECSDIKILLSKIFEPDLCPLPFDSNQIYEFITERLIMGDENDIANALEWLHALSRMDISIPLNLLLEAFSKCAIRLAEIEKISDDNNENDLEDGRIAVHVTLIDIIALQMKLNDIGVHEIANVAEEIFSTCAYLLKKPFARGEHSCTNPEADEFLDCSPCQQSAFVYQTVSQLVEQLCPKQQMRIVTEKDEIITNWTDQFTTDIASVHQSFSSVKSLSLIGIPESPDVLQCKDETPKANILQYQTAKVHEGIEDMEFVGVLPSEELEIGVAAATTLTEIDVGHESCHVVTSTLVDSVKGVPEQAPLKVQSEFWDTSVGRFRFTIDKLPPQLRLIHSILTNFDLERDVDVQFYMLSILKYICLHCEALVNARREHRGFLIWAQENLLIPKLWEALRINKSQLAELAIPLIMHCLTIPCGEEVFWKTVVNQFISDSWQQRFIAVEHMSVLCQLANAVPISSNLVIQTSLSCGVALLISSVNDPNAAVAQRAILSLRAMPSASLKLMCLCLESQFDTSITDRALIINRIQILTQVLPDQEILSWDFFIQRFESLTIESQLQLRGTADSTYVHDLMHSDPMSEIYQRRLSRARQVIDNTLTVHSIVRSLRENTLRHHMDMRKINITNKEIMRSYGRLREFTDEESNACLLFNRVVDMENSERHIVYMTISLFVSFLRRTKKAGEDKATAKKQSLLLRHFNTLIGYSNSEKCFTIPPKRLQKSAICNAFLAGLPEILDCNLLIANQIITLSLQLLIHLPSPQRFASDQPTKEYSLASLQILLRHSWLNSLILILYKYRYDAPPMSEYIRKLILIVLCTLETQVRASFFFFFLNALTNFLILTTPLSPSDSLVKICPNQNLSTPTDQRSDPNVLIHLDWFLIGSNLKINLAIDHSQRRGQLRCGYCNGILENVDEESLSLCFIAIETFVHREPTMAAPLLFRIIDAVTKLIDKAVYPWHDTPIFISGNSRSVAKQLLRVLLQQMSSSGICLQLFNTNIEDPHTFWPIISFSLADFQELNPVSVIQNLLEDIIDDWPMRLSRILFNLAEYIQHVPADAYFLQWNNVVSMFDTFFRRLLQGSISLVEGFSKWMTEAMHECKADLLDLLAICTACNRALVRERDKQCLTKAIVSELIQAIKFKCDMNEHNYVTIIAFILQDAGENISEETVDDQFNTSACEAIRPYIMDIIEFISDLHVLAKLKKITSSDNIGGDIKASLAQVVAIEMSRVKDARNVNRFIPWLISPPSVTQSSPGTFAEAVTNVRLLSWLLLGALHATQPCMPVPIECSQYMADYIHFVLAGFADQSKQSVVHMSALFHAFHLCQLWTVYCEQAALTSNEFAYKIFANILDFWARVTPAILQLLSHSKVLADMVNLHFLNTMQALQQCNSAVLCQLSAMWQPILTAYHGQIPSQLRMKLDSCENQPSLHLQSLSQWLKGVRYKISQIELQTSAASPFYNV
ncbi:unnamed protein product, partial [Dracunculus medinensis]|uniref:FAT domain-containing protein n=1 Tax=Dracunculus medinensis TaxID=318479 RepID=A0A0N4UA33_DRAME